MHPSAVASFVTRGEGRSNVSKKMTMLLAGTLVASLVAAAFALTRDIGTATSTIPITPAGIVRTQTPITHTRVNGVRKNGHARSGSARTLVTPSPSLNGGTASEAGAGVPSPEVGELRLANPTESADGDD
jgi:hypothetical protein